MSGWEWTQVVANIATIAVVMFAVPQLIGARAAKHRDFENLYVQRYWDLMDGFKGDPWTASPADDMDDMDRARINAYLKLCEDELDLRAAGFVTTKTWEIWADGMRSQCLRHAYRGALEALDADELPALRRFLRTDQDPLEMYWLRKWWSGIGFRGRKQSTSTQQPSEERASAPT